MAASPEWMNYLQKHQLTSGSEYRFAGNSLGILGHVTTAQITNLSEPASVGRLAMADPLHVPAGIYGKKAFECAGVWNILEPVVIPTLDARAALTSVVSGAAEVAMAYGSDATLDPGLNVLFPLLSSCTPKIDYMIAEIQGTDHPEAAAFVLFTTDSLQLDLSTEEMDPFGQEWSLIILSARIATVAIATRTIPGILTVWYLARRRSPLAFVVENLVQPPLALPPVVTGLLLLIILDPRGSIGGFLNEYFGIELAFTSMGAAIAAGVMAFPLLIQTFRLAFEQIDPEWGEAVLVYGGGRWAVFRWVTFPLALKGILAGIILGFARDVGEFGTTIVFAGNIPGRTQTVPLAVFTRLGQVGTEASLIRLVLISIALSVISLSVYARLFIHTSKSNIII